jgi:hypothetical protein
LNGIFKIIGWRVISKMGFISSILIVFFLGWLNSYLYRKYLRKRNEDWIVFLAVISIGIFWILDCLIYFNVLNIIWLNSLPWINIPLTGSGRYFLWNSFMLIGMHPNITPQAGMEIVELALIISYLPWYICGKFLGKILHGYKTYQQGTYWPFRPTKAVIKEKKKQSSKK